MSRDCFACCGSVRTPAKEQSVNEVCADAVFGCGLNSCDTRGNNRHFVVVGNRSCCGGGHNEAGDEDWTRSVG